MCVYNNMMYNHQNQIKSLKDKLERKSRECEMLKRQLAENKKEAVLLGQTDDKIINNQATVKNAEAPDNSECQKLKEEIKKLENKLAAQTAEESGSEIVLRIPCTEPSLFKNEIQDYLYALLYSAVENEIQQFPKNKADEHYRKLDVLSSILNARTFKWEQTNTNKNLSRVITALNTHKKYNYDNLPANLFYKKDNCRNHLKYCFVSDRYQITFSLTPSDGNASKQQAREIKKRCFLMPANNNTRTANGL